MKELKICILSFRSLPLYDERYNIENVMGGAEISLYNLAICFSAVKNVKVSVLVDDFGQPPVYRRGNVELIRFEAGRSWRQLLSLAADVFLFSCSHAYLGKLVLLQKLLKGKKVFFRVSSDLNLELESFRAKNGYWNSLFYKFGLLKASAVVSQTEKQKALLKSRLGIESPVIENGFFLREEAEREKKGPILWVGRCIATKRPMLFVELAKCLPEEEFVMIMPTNKDSPTGEAREQGELAAEVRRSAGTLNNVRLIDYVAYGEIQAWFDRAKAYVCTSELEGFPNTFIQACLGGTPILSYRVDPDGMIGTYDLGYVCNDATQGAVSFLRELTPDRLDRYWERMRKYAAQKHDVRNAAKKYLALMGWEGEAITDV
jgi:glycosyltransferase involved in cell wall biosynthesis